MSDSPDKLTAPDKHSLGDVAHALTKGIAGAIPLVGPLATELLPFLFAAPVEQRRQKWMEKVCAAINELDRRYGTSADDLKKDPHFISLVLEATHVALKNHHEAKLYALKNSIVSGGKEKFDAKDDETHAFLRLIDDLSPAQLQFVFETLSYDLSGLGGPAVLRTVTLPPELKGELRISTFSPEYWLNSYLEEDLRRRGIYVERLGRFALSEFGYQFRIFIRGVETDEDEKWHEEVRARERQPILNLKA